MAGNPQGLGGAPHGQPYFRRWQWDGMLDLIHHELYVNSGNLLNERPVRRPPSSIARASKAPKMGARIDTHGYEAGKKVKGNKRHVLVDTQGLLLHALIFAADLQDRDGGVLLMPTLFGLFPFQLELYADGAYQVL